HRLSEWAGGDRLPRERRTRPGRGWHGPAADARRLSPAAEPPGAGRGAPPLAALLVARDRYRHPGCSWMAELATLLARAVHSAGREAEAWHETSPSCTSSAPISRAGKRNARGCSARCRSAGCADGGIGPGVHRAAGPGGVRSRRDESGGPARGAGAGRLYRDVSRRAGRRAREGPSNTRPRARVAAARASPVRLFRTL